MRNATLTDNRDGTMTLFLPQWQGSPLARAWGAMLWGLSRLVFRLAWGNLSPFPPSHRFDRARVAVGRFGVLLASFSDYAENKILDHAFGKTAWAPGTSYLYMALCTVTPTDASTGASITEATYTGYARAAVAASALNSAASGSISNGTAITFAACTAGSSTIIGGALCDSGTTGAGNAIMWFTVTSKVIDTSNTPPTVAIGVLSGTLD